MLQSIVFERDLDQKVYRQKSTTLYYGAAFMGGIIVILYLIGYALVSCLTVNAQEDHMV